uniref:Uncharacterized protein n=1 Tax=Timema poppense TaxID=170557 RepID=A0A7R9DTB8_TIMPO|nr:unnamed protein product [Timema poppensis]
MLLFLCGEYIGELELQSGATILQDQLQLKHSYPSSSEPSTSTACIGDCVELLKKEKVEVERIGKSYNLLLKKLFSVGNKSYLFVVIGISDVCLEKNRPQMMEILEPCYVTGPIMETTF